MHGKPSWLVKKLNLKLLLTLEREAIGPGLHLLSVMNVFTRRSDTCTWYACI